MNQHKPKVLWVDDDPAILGAAKVILGDVTELTCTDNGVAALEFLRSEDFSMFFIDLHFPYHGMQGEQIYEKARSVSPDLKLVIVSALPFAEVIRVFQNIRQEKWVAFEIAARRSTLMWLAKQSLIEHAAKIRSKVLAIA